MKHQQRKGLLAGLGAFFAAGVGAFSLGWLMVRQRRRRSDDFSAGLLSADTFANTSSGESFETPSGTSSRK